jgi:hypothetical protein
MADDTTASVIPLHQAPQRKEKTGTKRARVNRPRKKPKAEAVATADAEPPSSDFLIPPEFLTADGEISEPPLAELPAPDSLESTPPVAATTGRNEPITPSRPHLTAIVLSIAAVGLGAVGIAINGWFARSLGSSAVAGWLFLAIGVAADLVALVMPSCAAGLWQAGQRATALVGWTVWLVTFVFAVTAGIGFASTNISDVTLARASRVTPAVAMAQAALTDAVVARDRECKSGVGKFCRERESAVAERRQILDAAMSSVGQSSDPQTDAAVKLVTWVSDGLLRPGAEDFAMLRLILLALLPQIGGILIMVGRHAARRMPGSTLAS